ncbi:hypothetical protein KSP39_PZI004972 [Platanthera zijinensis]|uniref:ATP-dependent DNA helicase n=1 Tax=Platanthera zijinensis TaxID=2320716 RepID=A0AAP0BR72_9ASPA
MGLCNGSRLLCRHFSKNIIDAEILTGQHKGKSVFLPRIPLKHAGDFNMSFELTRKQFPVRLSFAITINKSQGKTIRHVGLYLPSPIFTHGQLYVALSRGVNSTNTKVLVKDGLMPGHPACPATRSPSSDYDYNYYDDICKSTTSRWFDGPRTEIPGFRLRIPAVPPGLSAQEEWNFVFTMIKRLGDIEANP